jgi:hypothetical protein
MMKRRMIAATMALAAVAAMGPAAATAGDGKAKTTLKAEFNESAGQPAPHFYTGKVKSPKESCTKQRPVKLKDANGNLVTSGQSSSVGLFGLQQETPAPVGLYTIKAPATEKCKGAKVTLQGGG